MFRYLHYGLAAVLAFVGAKMIGQWWFVGDPQQASDSRVGVVGRDRRAVGDRRRGVDGKDEG